jgi:hypothetical protein
VAGRHRRGGHRDAGDRGRLVGVAPAAAEPETAPMMPRDRSGSSPC